MGRFSLYRSTLWFFLVSMALMILIPRTRSYPFEAQNERTLMKPSHLEVVNVSPCTKPRIRKEWRRMDDKEKQLWIDAVHCMHNSPSKYNKYYNGVRHRYDDFVALHINATKSDPGTHNTGYFLPFHRYLLWIWENTIQEECGYPKDMGQPWWDWSLDTPEKGGHFETSPVWNEKLGFGGNGIVVQKEGHPEGERTPGCVTGGPWAAYQLNVGPEENTDYNPRCLTRDFNGSLGEISVSTKLGLSLQQQFSTFENFSELDHAPTGYTPDRGGPHTTGHNAVGGEMEDLHSSTNDPIFWVHHGGIDQFWYRWQGRNRTRIEDATRSTLEWHLINSPCPQNKTCGVTNVDTQLFQIGRHAPVIPIRKVMDTLNADGEGILCYKYDQD